MARKLRICPAKIPQHIIQRGNNRQVCFAAEADFAAYTQWLTEAAEHYGVQVHAWVFMINHVHLLATPLEDGAVSAMMQCIGRRYVRYFNMVYLRTGTLWEGRFKSCLIHSDNYLLTCQRYIELNPVRARMVSQPEEYHWSSYHANARGINSELWTPHEQYLDLGQTKESRLKAYCGLFETLIQENEIDMIRQAVNQGLPLGSNRFRTEMEHLTGIRQHALKRGPKRLGSE